MSQFIVFVRVSALEKMSFQLVIMRSMNVQRRAGEKRIDQAVTITINSLSKNYYYKRTRCVYVAPNLLCKRRRLFLSVDWQCSDIANEMLQKIIRFVCVCDMVVYEYDVHIRECQRSRSWKIR